MVQKCASYLLMALQSCMMQSSILLVISGVHHSVVLQQMPGDVHGAVQSSKVESSAAIQANSFCIGFYFQQFFDCFRLRHDRSCTQGCASVHVVLVETTARLYKQLHELGPAILRSPVQWRFL